MKNKQGISLLTLILSCSAMAVLAITIIIILLNAHLDNMSSDYEYYDDCTDLEETKITVKNGDNEIEVGATVNYMPEGVGPTNYTGGWKLLGTDKEGNLLILSNKSITGSELYLGGYEDFLNAIKILNDTCKEYIDGTIGISARSINLEDIEGIINYDKTIFNLGNVDAYNNEVTYSWNGTEYPIYSYNYNGNLIENKMTESHSDRFTYYDIAEGGLNLEVLPKIGIKKPEYIEHSKEKIVTLKSNYYRYLQTRLNNLAEKMLFENTEKGNGSYWVADRYIATGNDCVCFGVHLVEYRELAGFSVFSSNGFPGFVHAYKGVRAVVTLAKDVKLKESITLPGTYDIIK